MKSIREEYETLGVDQYYETQSAKYSNPHLDQVRQLLSQNENKIDYSKILDLACGHGEVSQFIKEKGYNNFTGCDPYTWREFQIKLKSNCLRYSFEDIIRGKLEGKFSSIICSFAMHLCPEKQLYPLVNHLSTLSTQLIIITPHKRPVLENLDGVRLDFEDFCLTPKGKKVRLKAYSLSSY